MSFAFAWSLALQVLVGVDAPLAQDIVRAAELYEVEVIRDIAYYEGKDADPVKHRLDLYLPKGKKDFPVMFFVHGGGWRHGDKKVVYDIHGKIGLCFARHGVGTVVINYRLSPKVQHPGHIEDVARAFSWTHRNIGKHGGRADQIVVCGHSAGAHLASLLVTNAKYLEAYQLSVRDVRAVVAMSGVYVIPGEKVEGTLKVNPLIPPIPIEDLLRNAFGTEPKVRRDASPIEHVRGEHPPFLILYADGDFPTCDEMSEQFCKALQKCKCEACAEKVAERSHLTIVMGFSIDTDPVCRRVLKFIREQTRDPIRIRP